MWLPGERNVADGLTKHLAVENLMISSLQNGKCTLCDDQSVIAWAVAGKTQNREKRKKKKEEQELESLTPSTASTTTTRSNEFV